MDFDLSALQQSDTSVMTVYHPVTGDAVKAADGNPWTITFAGPGHAKTIDQKNAQLRKALRRQRLRGNEDQDPAELQRENCAAIVGRMLEWNAPNFNGQPYAFSEENAMALLMNPKYQWLREDCQKFITDDASFLKNSAQS